MKNELSIEIIKTDLKNSIESGVLTPEQQLMAINEAVKFLSLLDDEKINSQIKKYRDLQKQEQDIIIKAQNQIFINAEKIYKAITTEL